MESEQATPMDSIKDVVQSSVKVPKFKYEYHIFCEVLVILIL